jgi:hypothetical protein
MPSPPARIETGLDASRGALGAIARFWRRTYAPDYVGLVILIVGYSMVCLPIWSISRKPSPDMRTIGYDFHGAIPSHVHARKH